MIVAVVLGMGAGELGVTDMVAIVAAAGFSFVGPEAAMAGSSTKGDGSPEDSAQEANVDGTGVGAIPETGGGISTRGVALREVRTPQHTRTYKSYSSRCWVGRFDFFFRGVSLLLPS